MERVFLAVIASGLLLAATSMSLLVARSGDMTVAELKLPPAAARAEKVSLYQTELATGRPASRDDRWR